MPQTVHKDKMKGLEVTREAAELLKRVIFRTDERVDLKGKLAVISITPRWNKETKTFRVIITCYARAHQVVDWSQCQIICWSENDNRNFYIRSLSRRGQAVIEDILPGDYKISLKSEKQEIPPSIPIGTIASAAAILIFGVLIWPRPNAIAKAARNAFTQTAAILEEIITRRRTYEAAWANLRFEKVVKPTLRVLMSESGGRLNFVRVELSPRVEEGLVRDVSVCWGDAGNKWEPIYEAEGNVKNFQAIHKYTLPPAGQINEWFLQVLYTVTDAVAAARRLTPDQLTSTCKVEATSDGISLLPEIETKGLTPQVAAGAQPEITWLEPASGTQVSWKTTVMLSSTSATERVTILVRPHPGSTFYVQSGGHPLSANIIEPFDVQLGANRQQGIGRDFDILAVCSNNFKPVLPMLDMSDVPHSLVVARITVTKVAGSISIVADDTLEQGQVRIKGWIWTPNGGALLLRKDRDFEVLETLPSSSVGSRFKNVLSVKDTGRDVIYLLVYQEDSPPLQVGQKISRTVTDSYWLYGPARKLNEK
jgi:hypothetical protein